MSSEIYHLAQFNIIKLKDHLDSPLVKEFKDFLAPVNRLAEESPGFVWRLQDDDGESATGTETPYEDKLIFVNMSVWINYQYLKDYVYNTVHSYFLRNRKRWSNEIDGNKAVMWYVKEGATPSLIEAKEKLDLLDELGSTPKAFNMTEVFNSDGSKLIK